MILDISPLNVGHHGWQWSCSGQPVRVVVALGEVTYVIGVAEEVGHCAEFPHATTRGTWVVRIVNFINCKPSWNHY